MNRNESKYFNTASKMNDALIDLLGKKSFEYISVQDVCKAAKVNRSTFYLHYSNTSELLEEVMQNLFRSFQSHIGKTEDASSIVQKSNLSELFLIKTEFLTPFLQFVKDNKTVFKAIKTQPAAFNLDDTYHTLFHTLFSPVLSRFGVDKKFHKYIMDFYIHGIFSAIFDWVYNDCDVSVEELEKLIEGLIVSYDQKDN